MFWVDISTVSVKTKTTWALTAYSTSTNTPLIETNEQGNSVIIKKIVNHSFKNVAK